MGSHTDGKTGRLVKSARDLLDRLWWEPFGFNEPHSFQSS